MAGLSNAVSNQSCEDTHETMVSDVCRVKTADIEIHRAEIKTLVMSCSTLSHGLLCIKRRGCINYSDVNTLSTWVWLNRLLLSRQNNSDVLVYMTVFDLWPRHCSILLFGMEMWTTMEIPVLANYKEPLRACLFTGTHSTAHADPQSMGGGSICIFRVFHFPHKILRQLSCVCVHKK